MKRVKAALFDLDGVIVDTAKYHFEAWYKLAKQLGYVLTEADNEKLKGISRADSLTKILAWAETTVSEQEFKALMGRKNDDYLQFIQKISPDDVLPGVLEALRFLKTQGIKIGLGSASKNAVLILERLRLTPYFEIIVDGNHVSKSKPDPEVFLKGCVALGVAPEDTVVFEDANAGVAAAKAAGMTAIALGNPENFEGADDCYPDFKALNQSELSRLFF